MGVRTSRSKRARSAACAFSLVRPICASLLAACASVAVASDDETWSSSRPADDADYLYGLGTGGNQYSAIQRAQREIASALATTLSAATMDRSTDTDGRQHNSVDDRIRTSVAEIKLSALRVVDSQVSSGRYRVIVQVDRKALGEIWRREIGGDTQEIDAYLNEAPGREKFLRWQQGRKLLAKAEHLDALESLLLALLPNGAVEPGGRASKLKAAVDRLASSMKVRFVIDDLALNDAAHELLAAEGLHFAECTSNCDLLISMNSTTNVSVAFGQTVALRKVVAALAVGKQQIAQGEWTVRATSTLGVGGAQTAASSLAARQLRDEGLWKSVGL